ncbi:MAG: cysteine desulfurase [Thermoleophilia bacterium]|nr:cysteine desulfurase [Thermoleophilia bacterium]
MEHMYLDYNATTPAAPEVVEEMAPYQRDRFGNPSSGHWYGRQTKAAVARGRDQVASLLGCSPAEIVFTGGGSEANNHAVKGPAWADRGRGDHIITSSVEHPAIVNPCRWLEGQGFRVTWLPVDGYGMVDPGGVEDAITDKTILVTIMHANNEVGTIQPVAAIGEIARERGVPFHTDAAQSVGKIPVRVDELKVDLLTVAAHKLYGPKGVGALYVREGTVLESLIHGAGHENGRRAGTENVAGIAGLGRACELAAVSPEERMRDLARLRDEFQQMLEDQVGEVLLNGHPEERLPNTLNVSFPGINAAGLLDRIPEICASTGSACHHGSQTLSPVLEAMGIGAERGFGAVRFSIGRWTSREELERAAQLIGERLR